MRKSVEKGNTYLANGIYDKAYLEKKERTKIKHTRR